MWLAVALLHLVPLIVANYCEFGLCNETNQYCCGKNKCCNAGSNMWFFWAGILVVVFILVVVAICNRKSKGERQRTHTGYDQLSTHEEEEAENNAESVEAQA